MLKAARALLDLKRFENSNRFSTDSDTFTKNSLGNRILKFEITMNHVFFNAQLWLQSTH